MVIRARHWREVQGWRWSGFSPRELACKHCQKIEITTQLMDTLQRQRDANGEVVVTSAFRCKTWNILVGGVALSQHTLGRAADQALRGRDKAAQIEQMKAAGFTGLGVNYSSFVHGDVGPRRQW